MDVVTGVCQAYREHLLKYRTEILNMELSHIINVTFGHPITKGWLTLDF